MSKLNINSIIIKSKEKTIFKWFNNGQKIIIFHYKNESGKSTLYKIIEDIIECKGLRYDAIITSLSCSQITVEMNININSLEVEMHKIYIKDESSILVKDGIRISPESLKVLLNGLLKFPLNLRYGGERKLTYCSLLRLNFIDDANYKAVTVNGKSECNIINHQYDSLHTPLFYKYIFKDYPSETALQDLYNLVQSIKDDSKVIDGIKKLIEYEGQDLSGDLFYGNYLENLNLSYKEVRELKQQVIDLQIEIIEIKKSISIFRKLVQSLAYNLPILNSLTSSQWKPLLDEQIQLLSQIKKSKEDEVIKINLKIESLSEYMEKLYTRGGESLIYGSFKITNTLPSLSDREGFKAKSDFCTTRKNSSQNKFDTELSRLKESKIYNSYLQVLSALKELPDSNEVRDLTFLSEKGRIQITSSSDSTNRIARFNAVVSFLFTPNINHLNFLVIDSPFIGVDKERELECLKKLINHSKENQLQGQIFLFLNKSGGDSDKEMIKYLQEDEKELVDYIYTDYNGKIFDA